MHPADAHLPAHQRRVLIRGFKVSDEHGRWWSECLVCSNFYDENLEPAVNPVKQDGWFCDDTKPLDIQVGSLVLITKDGRSVKGIVGHCTRWMGDWDIGYTIPGRGPARWKQALDGGVVRLIRDPSGLPLREA